ncbi:hypothetical protein [Ascidiimonas aurantiaca]|uniref:hypothetical protein n=1 Tax=Ascidiimonas aurantiaca TaxID=1685432 RepID=UPI0030EE3B64
MTINEWQERFNWFFYKQRLYLPIIPHIVKLGYNARNLSFFTAVNPGLKNGGFVNASKYEVLKQIPDKFLPKTLYIDPSRQKEEIITALETNGWYKYPLIAKPDVGERGYGVCKINNVSELIQYRKHAKSFYLLQEFVDMPLEVCILYYRMPGASRGNISSIGFKEFLKVTGNGKNTLYELIVNNTYIKQNINLKQYLKKHASRLHEVPEAGHEVRITDVASRGTGVLFKNYNHLYSEKLVSVFDRISKPVNGFYYGRYDIKVNSFEELQRGENIKILELNGVNGQPIHCYDPEFSKAQFIKEMKKHWDIIYNISTANIEKYHLKPSSLTLLKDIIQHINKYQS